MRLPSTGTARVDVTAVEFAGPMSAGACRVADSVPPRKAVHVVPIAEEYLAELRARVEAVGLVALAKVAGISRKTVWRTISGEAGRRPTIEAITVIVAALAKLEPKGARMPAPVVAVRGTDHEAWIKLADKLTAAELAAVAADPVAVLAAARPTRRRRK